MNSWESLSNKISQLLTNTLGSRPYWSLIILLMLAFFVPIYFVIRRFSTISLDRSRTISADNLPGANLGGNPLSGGVLWDRQGNPEGTVQGLDSLLSRLGKINIAKTVTIAKPIVYKLGNDELQRAKELLKAGTD